MVAAYRALWNVPGGGAGYSSFYVTALDAAPTAQDLADAVRALFLGVSTYIPSGVTISFESEVRVLNTGTGALESVENVVAPAQVGGAAAGAYAGGAGVRIDWRTGGIVNSRRVTGRTFIVPVIGSVYENNGTILAAVLTDIQADADAYLSTSSIANSVCVWSRPVVADPEAEPPIAARNGTVHLITSAAIPDKVALLRSRRD